MKRKRGRVQRPAPKTRGKLTLALIGVITAGVLCLAYLGGRWLEERLAQPQARGDYRQRYSYEKTIEVDGISYRQRRETTTILLMGIDKDSRDETVTGYRDGGQADFLRLIVIDEEQNTVSQLKLDRDTMTPIAVPSVLGNTSRMRTAQISLAYGFGGDETQSCALTVDAVSNLLLNTPVDFYFAMNMDAVAVLNDLVGGVTVTLEDDFSALDPAMTRGATLTLTGEQALIYVRGRRGVGEGTNEERMQRQQVFLDEFTKLVERKQAENETFLEEAYDALSPYSMTNISKGRLINQLWAAQEFERLPLFELQGTHTLGTDGFMQFFVDEDSLEQTVLALFYEEVEA